MRAYRGIALAIAVCVLLQAAFIAFAWFDVLAADSTTINDDYEGNAGHAGHGIVGMTVIPLLSLVLLVTSLFTKTAGATKRAAMVFGAVVLQIVLAFVAFGAPVAGALHGLNAFVVLGTALYASRLTASVATVPQQGPTRETSTV